MKKFLWVLAFLLFLLLTGCPRNIDLGPGYDWQSKDFLRAMRWSDFYGAANLVVEAHREQLIQQFMGGDLHVVDSRIERVLPDAEGRSAVIDYRLEYYRLPSNQIKEWQWQQQWQRTFKNESNMDLWLIQNPPPAFP